MSTGNGFLTFSPDARYGNGTISNVANWTRTQKFTAPGIGLLHVSEMGVWIAGSAGTTENFHLAIFDYDSVNDCPSTIVANSDTGELSVSDVGIRKVNFIYSTQPQITGGSTYFFAIYWKNGTGTTDTKIGDTGAGLRKTLLTYPTWPTDTEWHTHTDETGIGRSFYAVISKPQNKYMRHGKFFKDGVKQPFEWAK